MPVGDLLGADDVRLHGAKHLSERGDVQPERFDAGPPSTQDLVGVVEAPEGNGLDASGHGHDLNIEGGVATAAPGRSGLGMKFDGTGCMPAPAWSSPVWDDARMQGAEGVTMMFWAMKSDEYTCPVALRMMMGKGWDYSSASGCTGPRLSRHHRPCQLHWLSEWVGTAVPQSVVSRHPYLGSSHASFLQERQARNFLPIRARSVLGFGPVRHRVHGHRPHCRDPHGTVPRHDRRGHALSSRALRRGDCGVLRGGGPLRPHQQARRHHLQRWQRLHAGGQLPGRRVRQRRAEGLHGF